MDNVKMFYKDTLHHQEPKLYHYEIALSYASEDREHVEVLAEKLKSLNVKVFYDKFEKSILWGKDLYVHLSDLYKNKARYCLIFLSKNYAAKVWTKHELQAAQARALSESKEYILPIRLDETDIPGILPTLAYLNWHQETVDTIADAIMEKLGKKQVLSQDFDPDNPDNYYSGL